METIAKTNKHIMPTYGRFAHTIKQGKGATAFDESGKAYIDFGSGIGTNSLGYCDDEWVEAVCAQVQTLQHTSNLYYTSPASDFAEKLCEVTGYANAFLCNSGAEANECAIKLARKYSHDKYGKGRHTIITLTGSFHGRTLTTLSATGQSAMHDHFFPFVEGFEYVEANDYGGIEAKLSGDDVCAVMLEYIQGEGGVVELNKDFVDAVFDVCAKKDILVIADEVQTGAGRTGKFLAGEWYGHKADITTMAKGLFGGLPGGACLANDKCANVLTAGTHGSTVGGNPVVMAGGKAVLDKVSDAAFLSQVIKKGDYIRARLDKLNKVTDISGKGLMLGITLNGDAVAADVAKAALERGVLVLTAKEKVRLLPPLNISDNDLDKGLQVLEEILS
ncbi:MAG: acetylornithine/succinylornithine family transaminase [Oscillospiraceae bacterium]|nr:acetylornithine/succinylornithine family transaminase [Oscillospiraceae bacterium]